MTSPVVSKAQSTGQASPWRFFSFGMFRVGDMPKARIEAFSDGVFAVILTLLVLEIHVPEVHGPDISTQLTHSLLAMAPKFFAYGLSFVILCVWWVAHHHLFHVLTRADRGLLWINCLFLLSVSVIPFPTALMGDYPREPVAVMSYGLATTMAGFSFCAMRYYAFYAARLVREDIDPHLLKRAMLRSMVNPVLHLFAMSLALVDTRLALCLYAALPLMFFVPSNLERMRHTRDNV